MKFIGALDQGTTSTRFILFDKDGAIIASHQIEHKQIFPEPGWVEHDPWEIWKNTSECITETLRKVDATGSDVSCIGITNQRETILAWNPKTGKVWHNAIVWQDLRGAALINELKETVDLQWLREKCGLIFSPYFAASKIAWLLASIPGLRVAAEKGEVIFGTIDTWLTWNLTGGKALVTDVTNASRYMLMNIQTCQWDDELLSLFNIPKCSLPTIVPSSGVVYANTTSDGPFKTEIPVCGILGDQQAALFGQACFTEGLGKSTYGTGCFLLVNTGHKVCTSKLGLLTTVAYQIGSEPPVYALEGSIAVAGSLVQWARDNLMIVESPQELDKLAASVPDCGGVYIVPAFSGLLAPYWRSEARGVIAGLTGFATKAHLCRAILEATAFQANDIFEAMEIDSGIHMTTLKVDGGLTNSEPLMAFQADLLGIPVVRPLVVETTALGAAYAAGLSIGVWKNMGELSAYWKEERRWKPTMSESIREKKSRLWKKAVSRTLNWISVDSEEVES
ncbi:glycerol kinase GlpK [uncultured Sphaerochaeta sp.]|uniref:glycerol kinase GlpK n=1 Tax=uncultured Sphaerochaeta sp. TaxID=886478 RepID=UPI002A0A64C8|nr:glycerol kinase GlpK [uncultured Sphaerochaeta sp.]